MVIFFFSSRRRHTRCSRDWSSDVCSSDLNEKMPLDVETAYKFLVAQPTVSAGILVVGGASCGVNQSVHLAMKHPEIDRKSTRLNSSHGYISYAVFCLKKKKTDPIVVSDV